MENGNKITIENVNSKIVWEIDNFSSRANQTEAIKSPIFEIVGPNGDKKKLSMEIYPCGFNGTQEYVALYVKVEESEKTEMPARIELSIMDFKGEEKYKTAIYTGRRLIFTPKSRLGSSKFIKRDWLLNGENVLLTGGKLIIVCHIDIEQINSSVNNIQIPPCQLTADFANLLDDGILADFVLISSDNKEFKAHKNVLTCRSPVFAAMVQQNGMTEAQNNRVKIEDIRGDVLHQMLHFIYTGDAPDIDTIAKELLAAADKYQIERLKVLCEQSLALSLNNGNACEFLVLADLHSANHLKLEANQFIKSNAKVIETDGWKWLAKEHSRLVVPLYEGMMKARIAHQQRESEW